MSSKVKTTHAKEQTDQLAVHYLFGDARPDRNLSSSNAMNADRNFLYGVVALQANLIDSGQFKQFTEVCAELPTDVNTSFVDLLVERGWIQQEDKAHLEYLVERKLKRHAGDASASLAIVGSEVKCSLAALSTPEFQDSITSFLRQRNAMLVEMVKEQKTEIHERYTLSYLHATGGIGRVWLARDTQLGRDVALKELRPEQADDTVICARFLKEAQITSQLEHPGIVPVYELARRPDTGQRFYTMRFVKGRTLSEAARDYHARRIAGRADSLEFATLLNAFVVVCKTLAYAHSRGVIHRDLKGQNVIVGDFGEVVVLDWGLAKLVDQSEEEERTPSVSLHHHEGASVDLTLQGDTLGTPGYMAPEQAAGRLGLLDRRTDVYGLGAMLYQLLTGKAPFSGVNTAEILRKLQTEEPAAPQQHWAEVPPTLQAACLRALAKEPSARFDSASELAHEIEQWQEVQRKQALEALRVSEEMYHSLVESIPVCVWRKDLNSRFTYANKGFAEFVGKTSEELIGKTDYDLSIPAELVEKIQRDDAHVMKTGQTLRIIEEHASPLGKVLEVIKIPIRDPRGEIIGTQGIFWDMTAWKRAQEEQGRRQKESS